MLNSICLLCQHFLDTASTFIIYLLISDMKHYIYCYVGIQDGKLGHKMTRDIYWHFCVDSRVCLQFFLSDAFCQILGPLWLPSWLYWESAISISRHNPESFLIQANLIWLGFLQILSGIKGSPFLVNLDQCHLLEKLCYILVSSTLNSSALVCLLSKYFLIVQLFLLPRFWLSEIWKEGMLSSWSFFLKCLTAHWLSFLAPIHLSSSCFCPWIVVSLSWTCFYLEFLGVEFRGFKHFFNLFSKLLSYFRILMCFCLEPQGHISSLSFSK